MNPPGQLITEGLRTITLYIYIGSIGQGQHPQGKNLWKLGTLSSYWSFVSRTPTFLSKASSMNRLRVLPWVPLLAPL